MTLILLLVLPRSKLKLVLLLLPRPKMKLVHLLLLLPKMMLFLLLLPKMKMNGRSKICVLSVFIFYQHSIFE